MIKRDPRSRTPYASICKSATELMHSDLLLYSQWFRADKDDEQYFFDYIDYNHDLFDTGKFDVSGLLEKDAWNKYNVRFGASSIRGTHGEMISIIIRNSQFNNTTGYSYSHNEEDEKKGKDCIVHNATWRQPEFVSQVKLLNKSLDDSCIVFKNRYFKYSTQDVDRLTLVDINNKMMYEMSYETIKKEILDGSTLTKRRTANGVEVSIEELLNFDKSKDTKELNFYTYWLKS